MDFINSDFHHRIEELENCIEAESFIKLFWEKINQNNKISDVLDMKYKNFSIAKIAFYDFSIKRKIGSADLLDAKQKNKYFNNVLDQITILENHKYFLRNINSKNNVHKW